MVNSIDATIKRVQPTRSADAAIKRGKKLLSEKKFDEALAQFEAIAAQGQANAFVYNAIGRIKFRQKEYDSAAGQFRQAMKLDPTHPQPLLRLARVHAAQGEREKAKEDLFNAIRLNPKSSVAHAGLGQVFFREKQLDQAIEHFRKALTFNPRLLVARKRLAVAYSDSGKQSSAMEQLKAALRIKPDDPEVHAIMGRLYLSQKDFEAAQKSYAHAIELNPEANPIVHMGLAEAFIQGDKTTEAEAVLNNVPQREQFTPLLHKLWGDLYNRKGLHKEAVEEYRAASLIIGEELSIEGMDALDLSGEESDETAWQDIALACSAATTEFLEKRRHAVAPGS